MENVTILKGADGKPVHAVIRWDRWQELLKAAGAESPPPSADNIHPVRAWRERRGYSQAQLAALVGISRAYLTQIETGERTGTLEVMVAVARALGCRIDDLVQPQRDPFAAAIHAIAAMPAQLSATMAAIPDKHWRTRPAAGGFSLLEHVCHLRDIDADGYQVRFERVLSEAQPILQSVDGDALARERDYLSQDIEKAHAAFLEGRCRIVARLSKLPEEDRRRTGLMDGTNEVTIAQLAEALVVHDSEHVQDLTRLREELAG
jgi:transcriptional regulator with XRE-family HTH domain